MDSSYLTNQVSTIIAQLHGLFDEIGVPNHERESKESEVVPDPLRRPARADTRHSFLLLSQRPYIVDCA